MNIDNFGEAFDSKSGGCRHRCECGKEFYGAERAWDWNEGEYEALEKDFNAIRVEYDGVARLEIEGVLYVSDCDCWHEKAKGIMSFLDFYASAIGEYYKLEKQRLKMEASRLPEIEN